MSFKRSVYWTNIPSTSDVPKTMPAFKNLPNLQKSFVNQSEIMVLLCKTSNANLQNS